MEGCYAPAAVSPDPAAPHLPAAAVPVPMAVPVPVPGDLLPRKHAACDGCRKRKLKCSGQLSGCSRCIKNDLVCVYSDQKQMGRPKKKKQKIEHSGATATATATAIAIASGPLLVAHTAIDPRLSAADQERTDFQNICTAPVAQAVRRSAPSFSMSSVSVSQCSQANAPPSDNSNHSSSSSSQNTNININMPYTPPDVDWYCLQNPANFASWPDFSQTVLPAPVADAYENENTTLDQISSGSDRTFNPDSRNNSSFHSGPECACLPNLYLTLSTLSSLSAFPPSSHSVSTLSNAQRMARDVIYCSLCPETFQTKSQNVMLCATLLTVLIDQWKRICNSSAIEVRAGFCSSAGAGSTTTEISVRNDLEWRTFTYQLMRYFVFGDHPLPALPEQEPDQAHSYLPSAASVCSHQHTTLLALVEAMERRQHVWHDLEPNTGEFTVPAPNNSLTVYRGLSLEEVKEIDNHQGQDNRLLCFEIVKHAKLCLRGLDREAPRLRHA